MNTITVRALFPSLPVRSAADNVPVTMCLVHRQTSLTGRTTTEGATAGVLGDHDITTGHASLDTPVNRARYVVAGVPFTTGKLTLTYGEWKTFDPAGYAERESRWVEREGKAYPVPETSF